MKKIPAFEEYCQTLTETGQQALSNFFEAIDQRVALPYGESAELFGDFQRALLYYAAQGLCPEEALSRLDPARLGGFYVRPPLLWYPLDDAAKVYPLSMKHGQMTIFRLSVYLKQAVVPELLQMALTFTIKRFPSFATTVKKGLFWHYLDSAKRRFALEEEADMPCRPLKIARSGSPSFRVLHYENRISVEYFHVLTDGVGGMVFLKTLTAVYLGLLGAPEEGGCGILDIGGLTGAGETANEFYRASDIKGASGFMDKPAAQMSGRMSRKKPCRILHYKMDAGRLMERARSKNATVTAYLLSLLFIAGKYATEEPEGHLSIQVPVNMRKYYPSDTLRNFSMYCGVKLALDEITCPEAILTDISRQLVQKSAKERMGEMMNSTRRLVRILRYVPLFIKAPAAKAAYGFIGDRPFTCTFSNLGIAAMPEGLTEYIDSMDFVLGVSETNRAACSMVTFGNTATLSISKMTADPSFEEKLYKLLTAEGLAPDMEGSVLYGR